MTRTLQYKEYCGSVAWSAEDSVLDGRLLGLRSMVTYEGADIDSLERNFRATVEKYLAFARRRSWCRDIVTSFVTTNEAPIVR